MGTVAIMLYIYEPKQPKIIVTNASLTHFNFTNTSNALCYNLTLNVAIPNKWVGIHYCAIQVIANYRKKTFALVNLASPPFYQGHKNTTILQHVLVEGQQLVEFGEH
ncbi:hypothetical protein GBA52_023792 [Prunus armeniaca]|nr:hypothetical protein GBA52_023792 [Prunus armeniaca]